MGHKIIRTGGIFGKLHEQLAGTDIDFEAFDPSQYPAERVAFAAKVWTHRVQTEFQSIQIMTRFMWEVLGSGDPLDVYAGAADAILDEIRHTGMCLEMAKAMGASPEFPEPLVLEENQEFLDLPMAQRALATAISMHAINETISTGFITDLDARCTDPVVKSVLSTTLADEDEHQDFGWFYVEKSLERFGEQSLPFWQQVATVALRPHISSARETLADVPLDRRHLGAWPEQGLADLGLFSPQRQALVFLDTYQKIVGPRLRELGLLVDDSAPMPLP